MKTIQVNDMLLEAAKAYTTYMETPLKLTEEEKALYAESEPSFFTLLGRFTIELARAIEESDSGTES